MKIFNKSKRFFISEECSIADSFFSRFVGLMLSRPRDLVLVSPKEDILSSSIHMLFMRYPIDVIWLNSRNVVVDIKEELQPFSMKIHRPGSAAMYVVELGTGKLGTTEMGDEIEFRRV